MSDVITFINQHWILWAVSSLMVFSAYIGIGAAIAYRLEKPLEFPTKEEAAKDSNKDGTRSWCFIGVSVFWPLLFAICFLYYIGYGFYLVTYGLLFPGKYLGVILKYVLIAGFIVGAAVLTKYLAGGNVFD